MVTGDVSYCFKYIKEKRIQRHIRGKPTFSTSVGRHAVQPIVGSYQTHNAQCDIDFRTSLFVYCEKHCLEPVTLCVISEYVTR